MRSRPTVRVETTPIARPGGRLDAGVELESRSETPVDFIDLRLTGREIVAVDADGTDSAHVVLSNSTRLSGPITLAEGTRHFRASFALPPDLPPSYASDRISVRYELEVIVSIPWWPGVENAYRIVVAPPRGPRLPASPVTGAVDRFGAELEMALDDRVFSPGDAIHGALALDLWSEAPDRRPRPRRFEVSVVGMERVAHPAGEVSAERCRLAAVLEVDEIAGGRACAFACHLPADLPITFFGPRSALYWLVEGRVDLGAGQSLVCEVPILVAPLEGPPRPGAERPAIGVERRRRAWATAGAPYGLALDPDALRLTGRLAGCAVAIGLVASEEGPPRLTGEIRYADLGLGLRVKGHLAEGRDPAQIRAAIDPETARTLAAFADADMDDARVIVRTPSARPTEAELAELVGDVAKLAGWIGVLRERVPPPAAMRASLHAWRALARSLGAPLTVGSMSIRGGALDGERIDVQTELAGPTPMRTRLTLHLAAPSAAILDVSDPGSLEGLPDGARRIAISLGEQVRSLRVEGTSMSVELCEPAIDPADLPAVMHDMTLLARLLREPRGAGPYR